MECEFPESNATDAEVRALLEQARTIAVVGASTNPDKDSHKVAAYLKDKGFEVFPVNPGCTELLGMPCYPDLQSVPKHIDIVDVFRRPEALAGVVDAAIAAGAGSVWMQLGLAHNAAADKARTAGLQVVMNKCIKIEHFKIERASSHK